jgi:hypothetical protein
MEVVRSRDALYIVDAVVLVVSGSMRIIDLGAASYYEGNRKLNLKQAAASNAVAKSCLLLEEPRAASA